MFSHPIRRQLPGIRQAETIETAHVALRLTIGQEIREHFAEPRRQKMGEVITRLEELRGFQRIHGQFFQSFVELHRRKIRQISGFCHGIQHFFDLVQGIDIDLCQIVAFELFCLFRSAHDIRC